jgi:hypothetical protein
LKSSITKALIVLLAGFSVLGPAVAQTDGTRKSDAHRPDKRNAQPTAGATITKFYIAEADPGSGYETGPLHILYSDGT